MNGVRETDILNRILGLEWRGGDATRWPSQLALFGEYLRRFALWAHALDWEDAHPIGSDLPGRLVPGGQAAPVNTTLMQQTLRTLGNTSVYERMLLTRMLNWAAVADEPTVQAYNLPDPYEPLLMFYERGGWLDKAMGDHAWEISGRAEQLDRAWVHIDLEPIPLDDPDYLDELDQGAD